MGFRDRYKKKKGKIAATAERAEERAANNGGSGSIFLKDKIPEGIGFWRPKAGEHLIDILPIPISNNDYPDKKVQKGDLLIDLQYLIYKYVGPLSEMFISPARNYGLKDPIEEYIQQHDLDKSAWNKVRAKQEHIYLVWVHDTPEEEAKGVQIWQVSWWFMFEPLKTVKINPRGGGVIEYWDIDHGKSIWFKIDDTGSYEDDNGKVRKSIKYLGHKVVDREEPIPDKILDQIFPVDTCLNLHPSYEDIYEAFYQKPYSKEEEIIKEETTEEGITEEEEEEEKGTEEETEEEIKTEEEEKPKKETKKKPKKKKEVKKKPKKKKDDELVCPHGHTFGVDLDEEEFEDDCEECEIWNECYEKQEKLLEEEED